MLNANQVATPLWNAEQVNNVNVNKSNPPILARPQITCGFYTILVNHFRDKKVKHVQTSKTINAEIRAEENATFPANACFQKSQTERRQRADLEKLESHDIHKIIKLIRRVGQASVAMFIVEQVAVATHTVSSPGKSERLTLRIRNWKSF